jgi:MFS family permease
MTNIQRARFAVFTYFLLCGAAVTVWATHIPDVELRLGLSHAQIGTIILLLGAGALASMQFLGAWVDKHGSAKVLVGISVALGLALMLPGFATDFWTLAVSIFLLGACIGGTDIAMNAHALVVEKAYKRAIFSSFHAMWSIGGVIGSLVVGATLGADLYLGFQIPMPVTMSVWGFITIIVALVLRNWLLPTEPQQTANAKSVSKPTRREFGFVIFVGLVSAAGAIVEGVGIDWSALYSVDRYQVTVATAAISITMFASAMAAVRFFADKVVERFGRIAVIQAGALIAAAGIAIALIAPTVSLSWIGWALAGLGISAVVPQCMAFGSEIGEQSNQGRNLAKVVGLTYAGVLGGPAIIGFIGQAIGLPAALTIGIGLAIFVAIGATLMAKGKKQLG